MKEGWVGDRWIGRMNEEGIRENEGYEDKWRINKRKIRIWGWMHVGWIRVK